MRTKLTKSIRPAGGPCHIHQETGRDKTDFLLINAYQPPSITTGPYVRLLRPMPPISLSYVVAALERSGFRVQFHDDSLCRGDREMLQSRLRELRPRMVGLSCVTPNAPGVYAMARAIRAIDPSIIIVMGNIHADVFSADILRQGLADYIVHGEGETTISHLVERLVENGGRGRDVPVDEIRGISFLRDGKVHRTPARPFIEELDSIPFPAWHLFPLDRYELLGFASIKRPGSLLLGSRGCPYRCTFCSLKIMGNRRRRRSADNIVSEIAWLKDRFGYRQVSFTDPIFPLSKREGLDFSEAMISRGFHRNMVWTTETRVDLVDEELLGNMGRAGLRRIMFGFESSGQEGIDRLGKSFAIAQSRHAVKAARKVGVEVIGFFMIGIPGETLASIEGTLRFSRRLDIDFAKYTVFSPFPGTRVYEELKAEGRIPETSAWERYTNYPTSEVDPIYMPDDLRTEDLIQSQRRALRSFYLRPRIILRHVLKIRTLPLVELWDGLLALFRAN